MLFLLIFGYIVYKLVKELLECGAASYQDQQLARKYGSKTYTDGMGYTRDLNTHKKVENYEWANGKTGKDVFNDIMNMK